MNQFEVNQAQQKVDAFKKRQEEAKLKLPEIRKLHKRLESELAKLHAEGKQLQLDEDAAVRNVMRLRDALAAHQEVLVNDLPDSAELAAWQKNQEALEHQLAHWVEKKQNVRHRLAILRNKVLEIEPQVTRLRFAEQHCKQLAAGDDPDDQASWTGDKVVQHLNLHRL